VNQLATTRDVLKTILAQKMVTMATVTWIGWSMYKYILPIINNLQPKNFIRNKQEKVASVTFPSASNHLAHTSIPTRSHLPRPKHNSPSPSYPPSPSPPFLSTAIFVVTSFSFITPLQSHNLNFLHTTLPFETSSLINSHQCNQPFTLSHLIKPTRGNYPPSEP
jgi:hypothetical protein